MAFAIPDRNHAQCLGEASSFLIEAKVVSCSTAEPLIRERIEELAEIMRKEEARNAEARGETPKPFDQSEVEADVQKRLKSRDAVVELSVRRSLRFSGWPELNPESAWQPTKDRKPVRYLVRIGSGGCSELGKGRRLVLFVPYSCHDNLPGPNESLLGLPLALDVPEDLLEHSRSGG